MIPGRVSKLFPPGIMGTIGMHKNERVDLHAKLVAARRSILASSPHAVYFFGFWIVNACSTRIVRMRVQPLGILNVDTSAAFACAEDFPETTTSSPVSMKLSFD